jgi:hypothetical protein
MCAAIFGLEGRGIGITDAYNIVSGFSDTLHTILQEAADEVEKFDDDAAERIEMFEYNWLSVVGYYKGLFPLVSDFFMNYYGKPEFHKHNGKFVHALMGIMDAFQKGRGHEKLLYTRIKHLLETCMSDKVFSEEGVISTFLLDFKMMVDDHQSFLVLVKIAQSKAPEMSKLLHFIIHGKYQDETRETNSEL